MFSLAVVGITPIAILRKLLASMIKIIEGNSYRKFYPLTLNHCSFEVRVGAYTLLEKILLEMGIEDTNSVILLVREELKGVIADRYPEMKINPSASEYSQSDIVHEIDMDIYLSDNYPDSSNLFSFSGGLELKVDSGLDKYSTNTLFTVINSAQVSIASSASISAGVILDASGGPIVVDRNAKLDIGSLVKGPAYIGPHTIINPGAKIKDVSIGPSCKIGGEVEHSTFQGYSNKQHDGYIGNSYIGEWVNLGANTNNSDLKNNYSNVKIKIYDNEIDTNEMFIGCLIGDYTRTAISTMINTGTYIGMGCNIFGDGFQSKFIENFSWGKNDLTEFDKFIDTLRIVKSRRAKYVSDSELKLLKSIYENKN